MAKKRGQQLQQKLYRKKKRNIIKTKVLRLLNFQPCMVQVPFLFDDLFSWTEFRRCFFFFSFCFVLLELFIPFSVVFFCFCFVTVSKRKKTHCKLVALNLKWFELRYCKNCDNRNGKHVCSKYGTRTAL